MLWRAHKPGKRPREPGRQVEAEPPRPPWAASPAIGRPPQKTPSATPCAAAARGTAGERTRSRAHLLARLTGPLRAAGLHDRVACIVTSLCRLRRRKAGARGGNSSTSIQP